MNPTTTSDQPIPSPARQATRLAGFEGQRKRMRADRARKEAALARVQEYLAVAPQVEAALDVLSQALFGKITAMIEQHLTRMLQEILEQNICLKVTREFKRGGATMSFHVERDGQAENIMKGQGGSVVNILSVGLRILALTTLDREKHRRFLVLDEQDCWLRPDLVPRLVKIVADAGRDLGFQTIMISHHDPAIFQRYADRIYSFTPAKDGSVSAQLMSSGPVSADE